MKTLDIQENIFKALSDKSRIRIIKMLQKKPLCVCEITAVLKLATSTVSNHLSILTDTNLIIGEKDGKWMNYRINTNPQDNLISSTLLFLQFILEDDETIINDRRIIANVDRLVLCCK
ncbi:MAG: metalloregulator ArsR/SmtB family transcription factor [Ignavibacteria bacterium]|jgi:ArsR family transcriptional regulator